MTTFNIAAWLILAAVSIALLVSWTQARRTIAELELQVAEAQARQLQNELSLSQRSQLDSIKDEFISTVSHELRTPLTSIRGALGLLSAGLMGPLDAKAHKLLRISVTNTDRLIRLINDILDLERMESGRAPLHLRRCSLTELVNQAIESMSSLADSARVRILFKPTEHPLAEPDRRVQSFDLADFAELAELGPYTTRRRKTDRPLPGPDPAYFDGDPDRVLQVLTNLLSNAIKFSPPGSLVAVTLEAYPELLRLCVADQGRGIPDDMLETIFDRFQQVEATDSRQKGGTGLGLAISRSIVQQHGGTIYAQRNSGPGVRFYIDLPRINRSSDHIPPAIPEVASPLSRSQGAIIVCAADAGVRSIVAGQLRRSGYIVLETASGEETLATAAAHVLDAILLDLRTPGIGGWKTLERLKRDSSTSSIPVVILSVLGPADHPAAPVAEAQAGISRIHDESLHLEQLVRALHPGDGPGHLLLVEHDPNLATIVIDGFHHREFRVDHATTCNQAMDRCLSAPPDLLLLNLALPDGHGFSLVDWIRTQPNLRAVPLIVYSGHALSAQDRAMRDLGPTHLLALAKVQPREVEELVLSMVHRLRRPA